MLDIVYRIQEAARRKARRAIWCEWTPAVIELVQLATRAVKGFPCIGSIPKITFFEKACFRSFPVPDQEHARAENVRNCAN
jgi:hypothetical protein